MESRASEHDRVSSDEWYDHDLGSQKCQKKDNLRVQVQTCTLHFSVELHRSERTSEWIDVQSSTLGHEDEKIRIRIQTQ